MSDILAAILAVPPAIDACKNLIVSWIARPSGDDGKVEARELHNKISEIAAHLVTFSEFSETVRKWKELHNVTQKVLASDLSGTFGIYLRGENEFAKTISEHEKLVSHEFTLFLRGRNGACATIKAMALSDFQIPLPVGVKLAGKNWGEHITTIGARAEAAYLKKQYSTLYALLGRIYTECGVWNTSADTHLKEGLTDITTAMHEFRLRIGPLGKQE